MPSLDTLLQTAVEENILTHINDYLYAFTTEAEEDSIDNFLTGLMHYYEPIIAIIRNKDDLAIGLFVQR